jgi:hypothetical protein
MVVVKINVKVTVANENHFSPFVVSTVGLIGREAGELLKRLSLRLADKWEWHSVVHGFVSARMSIVIVRATHLCLWGSRVPPLSQVSRPPQWEDGAGLGLFKTDY